MPQQGKQFHSGDVRLAQRAVVLQLLRDDHPERWSRGELERELSDLEPVAISEAIVRLAKHDVVRVSRGSLWATRPARHLDELDMVTI
jgi:hypothetical protein